MAVPLNMFNLVGFRLVTTLRSETRWVTFRLNPGETLCLYTDGMAEVLGANGTALGYEGLKQMLLECWSDQIDTYRQLLLQSHKNWAKKQDDDQTVILIKRDK